VFGRSASARRFDPTRSRRESTKAGMSDTERAAMGWSKFSNTDDAGGFPGEYREKNVPIRNLPMERRDRDDVRCVFGHQPHRDRDIAELAVGVYGGIELERARFHDAAFVDGDV